MDWKYKHFNGERTYPQPRDRVQSEARAFAAETLRWRISDIDGGFRAEGVSYAHAAIADFHVAPTGDGGTRVTVELAVERAGLMGFMLVDVGGAYEGQIAHWLEGVDDRLEGRVGAAAPHRPPSGGERLLSWMILVGVIGFGVWAAWTFVFAPLIGITTGELILAGRGGDLTLHGPWARGISAAILAVDAVIAVKLLRPHRRDRPKILG